MQFGTSDEVSSMKKATKILTAFSTATVAAMFSLNAHAVIDHVDAPAVDIGSYDYNIEALAQQPNHLIAHTLNHYTLGNDAFLNKILSPAKSLDMNKSDADRTTEANNKMILSLTTIISAFDAAADDKKAANVAAALKQLDPKFEKNESARIEFSDGKPSAAFSRIAFVIDKGDADAEKVLQSFTSYKRSAKPSDYVYEYENPMNISQGSVIERKGSDTSWFPPQAPPPLLNGQSLVVKKCRQILGWKCGTTFYNRNKMNDNLIFLFMGNHDLNQNQDNPYFEDDSRTKNQVAGSSALFIVRESAKHILFVGADSTWNKGGIMFGSIIQSEYQKDVERFKQRLMFDLKRTKNK